jgi:hypothetical protein
MAIALLQLYRVVRYLAGRKLPIQYDATARYVPVAAIPVAQVMRARRETEDSTADPR